MCKVVGCVPQWFVQVWHIVLMFHSSLRSYSMKPRTHVRGSSPPGKSRSTRSDSEVFALFPRRDTLRIQLSALGALPIVSARCLIYRFGVDTKPAAMFSIGRHGDLPAVAFLRAVTFIDSVPRAVNKSRNAPDSTIVIPYRTKRTRGTRLAVRGTSTFSPQRLLRAPRRTLARCTKSSTRVSKPRVRSITTPSI